jgi:hypothetical protein
VRRTFATLLLAACALAPAAPGVAATFRPAPAPGPVGPEGVPIPQVPVLAPPHPLKLGQTIDGIRCDQAEKVAFHVHAHLTIFVNGRQRQVPFGIGIGPPLRGENAPAGPFVTSGSCFAWLHTHAADGIIHIEAPKLQTFTLGEFFDLWGQQLSARQVGPAHGTVTLLVDGKVRRGDPRTLPLRAHEQIQLDVGTPLVAAQSISFGRL